MPSPPTARASSPEPTRPGASSPVDARASTGARARAGARGRHPRLRLPAVRGAVGARKSRGARPLGRPGPPAPPSSDFRPPEAPRSRSIHGSAGLPHSGGSPERLPAGRFGIRWTAGPRECYGIRTPALIRPGRGGTFCCMGARRRSLASPTDAREVRSGESPPSRSRGARRSNIGRTELVYWLPVCVLLLVFAQVSLLGMRP